MQVTNKTGSATNAAADGPKSSTTTVHTGGQEDVAAPTDSAVVVATTRPPANMFAKVHMEGYTFGRKINLRAHCSYDSLSRVLNKMTRNFFCRKYPGRKSVFLFADQLFFESRSMYSL
jgi:auxin-responsive protein IAA